MIAERIIAEARTWISTPYHHCGAVKGAGVDCVMFLIRVHVDLDLVPPIDPRPYPKDWFLHRDAERFLGGLADHCREVETPCAGDIMVFRNGRCFAHGAIVTSTDPLTIIHAFSEARGVVEHRLAHVPTLLKRERRSFALGTHP